MEDGKAEPNRKLVESWQTASGPRRANTIANTKASTGNKTKEKGSVCEAPHRNTDRVIVGESRKLMKKGLVSAYMPV